MATVQTVVLTPALRELAVLAEGETPSSAQSQDALDALNNLLNLWAGERLMIPSPNVETTFTITSGTGTYAVGTGSVVNVARPVYINMVRFRDTSPTLPTDFPLEKYSDADWDRIALKTLTSTLPRAWYYNPTYPTGTLKLYPVPTNTTLLGLVYAPGYIAEFAATTSTCDVPPGYRRMLVKNLALEIAPQFIAAVSPDLRDQARESKATVKAMNYRPAEITFEAGAMGSTQRPSAYSIRTDS